MDSIPLLWGLPAYDEPICENCGFKLSFDDRTLEESMLHSARGRAKKRGLPFNLTLEDVAIPDVCPILGIAIKRGEGNLCDSSPSLDRIVPELGYVKGNTAVISLRANRIKNDGTAEEHEKIAAWLRAHAATN